MPKTGGRITGPSTRKRTRWRRVAIGAVALIAIAAAGAGTVALADHGKPETTGTTKAPAATVTVIKTDLSDTRTRPGTLGFGVERPLQGAGAGLLTRLPKTAAPLARGKPLYWVNDRPVIVFFGDTPLFRKLDKVGVRGRDVSVVANNLRALGYNIGVLPPRSTAGKGKPALPGDVFTASLRTALKQWQLASGLQPTGTLDVGQVAILPGPVRVASVKAQLGDAVTGELMTVTPTAKVVTVPVDATDVGTIRLGAQVTIALPSGKEVAGKITAIGKNVQDGTGDSSGQNTPQLNVTVTPRKSTDVKALDSAAVQVNFTAEVRRGVLAVPVGALIALREGGYALQLPGGKLVAAQTGMFAKGMVEVGGAGITSGLKVVTSS